MVLVPPEAFHHWTVSQGLGMVSRAAHCMGSCLVQCVITVLLASDAVGLPCCAPFSILHGWLLAVAFALPAFKLLG